MKDTSSCRIGITMGDPFGIGPEIIARSLHQLADRYAITLFATQSVMERAAALVGHRWNGSMVDIADGAPFPETEMAAANMSISAIQHATRAAIDGDIDAIVTAPINKHRWALAGHPHRGHTEFLAELAGGANTHMLFISPHFRIALASIHVPIRDVAKTLTPESIAATIHATHSFLSTHAKEAPLSIDVLAIDPHAGDHGTIGRDDATIVRPAIEMAKASGLSVNGPFPADAYFGHRRLTPADAIIAMYHDQGLIPAKMDAPEGAVNVTMGLPFIRTSVDHGTAEDIAWVGNADERHFLAAVDMANRIFHKEL